MRVFAPNERGLEQSFGRAAAILDHIAAAGDGGMRFVEIVRQTGYSQTTVHRMMTALAAHGYIEQEGGKGAYFLGTRLFGWSSSAASRFGLGDVARLAMESLSELTGDTVYLSVRSGHLAVCLSRVVGSYPIKALAVEPGARIPLGLNAGGIALLAFIVETPHIERLLTMPELVESLAASGCSIDVVRDRIRAARHRGYALIADFVPGAGGVALPICNPQGEPVGSLSLAAISSRLKEPRLRMVLEKMADAVREIEARLRETSAHQDGTAARR
ncbi:transcriptional regulator [Chelatococcus reniformis]|uniref:Transcriptional regulator n=1 Tax=Chelatococcus reniformis TaxID=1494448 RepID=A0A916UR59_9HYPH|nr:transcriptional regulator [Chelatococcus reniformis]